MKSPGRAGPWSQWMEAGPGRLAVLRGGRVVHQGRHALTRPGHRRPMRDHGGGSGRHRGMGRGPGARVHPGGSR